MRLTLADEELERLRVLLGRAAGLVFQDSRRDSLSYCVAERLRATGDPDLATYLLRVEAPGSAELQPLLDEVTIQETHFFRNPPQVRALREHVLPELVRRAEDRGRRLRIWSAGCSTGEEPYTLAMLLHELLPSAAGGDVTVIGTDISAGALRAARSATYGARALQLATPEQLRRYFTVTEDGRYQVRPELRALVELRHHNLVRDPPPDQGLDLVLCRNVTIYFDRETTRRLMRRLHGALREGGYLLLGHSETLWQVSEDFRLVPLGTGEGAAFVYRRLEPGSPPRAVLPDRRTAQELPVPVPDRRVAVRRAPGPAPVGADRPASRPLDGPAPPPGTPADLAPARAAIAAGQYAQAARLARLVADVEPLTAEAHYLLGRALVEAADDAGALPALRRAVYLDPDAGLAHFLLAGTLARTGDPVAAAREYRAAAHTLASDPVSGTPELGGRSAGELASLCAQLEGQLLSRPA